MTDDYERALDSLRWNKFGQGKEWAFATGADGKLARELDPLKRLLANTRTTGGTVILGQHRFEFSKDGNLLIRSKIGEPISAAPEDLEPILWSQPLLSALDLWQLPGLITSELVSRLPPETEVNGYEIGRVLAKIIAASVELVKKDRRGMVGAVPENGSDGVASPPSPSSSAAGPGDGEDSLLLVIGELVSRTHPDLSQDEREEVSQTACLALKGVVQSREIARPAGTVPDEAEEVSQEGVLTDKEIEDQTRLSHQLYMLQGDRIFYWDKQWIDENFSKRDMLGFTLSLLAVVGLGVNTSKVYSYPEKFWAIERRLKEADWIDMPDRMGQTVKSKCIISSSGEEKPFEVDGKRWGAMTLQFSQMKTTGHYLPECFKTGWNLEQLLKLGEVMVVGDVVPTSLVVRGVYTKK